MSAMKLQKLVYYSPAWSLVWDDKPMFEDQIQAWANGPVCKNLYEAHRGKFSIDPGTLKAGDGDLTKDAVDTIDIVLDFYGAKSAQWLSDLTHLERPWREARDRAGAKDGDMCAAEITLESMAEYYSSLSPAAATSAS